MINLPRAKSLKTKAAKIFPLLTHRWSLVTLVLLFAIYNLLFTLSSPVFAQETTPTECQPSEPGENIAKESIDEINRCAIKSSVFDDKIFNLNQIAGVTDSLLVLLMGYSQLHPETNNLTANTGAVSAMNGMVASLYAVPPASGVTYMANKIQHFNPVQPAYAQEGTGFGLLSPVEKVWTAFRNISYTGFIIIFVVIGFMIMFRRKISAQAVATIQDSLPRIVIALILVTFSYAIAGLMIDIMFVALNILIDLLQGQKLIDLEKANQVIFQRNVFETGISLWGDVFKKVFGAIYAILNDMFRDAPIGLEKVIGFFGGGIVGIIAGFAVIFIMFKLFVMLLFAYVSILLLTIFAPFLFLFQALPGNNGAKEWFKQMGANLSIFFTVALMFLLAGVLSGIPDLGGVGEAQIEQANKVTEAKINRFPFLASGFNADEIGKLIAIGLVLMTPSAAKIVKDRFGVKDGAIGAGAGAALGALGAGAAPFQKAGSYAAAPYKQAMSHERTQRAYKMLTNKEMYGPTTASTPGNTGEGK